MTEVPVEINLEEIVESVTEGKAIVLYNDDVNSFPHVIACLIEFCRHSYIQAEQCALIVHEKGKYAVKQGDEESLKPILEMLLLNKLSAKLE